MIKISICVGSACHLRGSHAVLNAFTLLIQKYNLKANVIFEGNFCQGRCTEGVIIKINEEVISNVSQDKVYDIFLNKVMGREKT